MFSEVNAGEFVCRLLFHSAWHPCYPATAGQNSHICRLNKCFPPDAQPTVLGFKPLTGLVFLMIVHFEN